MVDIFPNSLFESTFSLSFIWIQSFASHPDVHGRTFNKKYGRAFYQHSSRRRGRKKKEFHFFVISLWLEVWWEKVERQTQNDRIKQKWISLSPEQHWKLENNIEKATSNKKSRITCWDGKLLSCKHKHKLNKTENRLIFAFNSIEIPKENSLSTFFILY